MGLHQREQRNCIPIFLTRCFVGYILDIAAQCEAAIGGSARTNNNNAIFHTREFGLVTDVPCISTLGLSASEIDVESGADSYTYSPGEWTAGGIPFLAITGWDWGDVPQLGTISFLTNPDVQELTQGPETSGLLGNILEE